MNANDIIEVQREQGEGQQQEQEEQPQLPQQVAATKQDRGGTVLVEKIEEKIEEEDEKHFETNIAKADAKELTQMYLRDEAEARSILECGKNSCLEIFSPLQFVKLHEMVFNEKEDYEEEIAWEIAAEKTKAEEKWARFSQTRTSLLDKSTKAKTASVKKKWKKKEENLKKVGKAKKKAKVLVKNGNMKMIDRSDAEAQLAALKLYIEEGCGGTLPDGWTASIAQRKQGATAGQADATFWAPGKSKRCRSRVEVARHLGLQP